MDIEARVVAYNTSPLGVRFPASHLRIHYEGPPSAPRSVAYGRWVLGNDYKNRSGYYGAYPPSYVERVMALFPDAIPDRTLHVFAGMLPPGPYVRLDIRPECQPDVLGSVYDVGSLVPSQRLVLADPIYSEADAKHYGVPMVNRKKAIEAIADVVEPGGHLVWLDTQWPMHAKRQWRTVGRIAITRCTQHRIRDCTIFERQ